MREMSQATPLVIVGIPLILGMLDVALYYFGGNEATISKVMLNISGTRKLVALCTAWSLGVLMGHLFFPTFTERSPPAYEVVARMWLVLSPTVYALIIIGAGNGVAAAHSHALAHGGQLALAGYAVAAAVAGGVAGKLMLPQHLDPVEKAIVAADVPPPR